MAGALFEPPQGGLEGHPRGGYLLKLSGGLVPPCWTAFSPLIYTFGSGKPFRAMRVVEGLAGIVVGVSALAWPGITAVAEPATRF